jgi:hypothetical protein
VGFLLLAALEVGGWHGGLGVRWSGWFILMSNQFELIWKIVLKIPLCKTI